MARSRRNGTSGPAGCCTNRGSVDTRLEKGTAIVEDMTGLLTNAAALAGYAPSIHNTQPWRWRVSDKALDLYVVPARQLAITDPDGRLSVLSCGAALHHALVALAAEGQHVDVTRLPDPADPDHLARIVPRERTAAGAGER